MADAILKEKEKIEQELGEEVPVQLPQEGGTTATLVVVHPRGVFTAWVGDSRAVLAVRAEDGRFVRLDMTYDHNVNDPMERARRRHSNLPPRPPRALRPSSHGLSSSPRISPLLLSCRRGCCAQGARQAAT